MSIIVEPNKVFPGNLVTIIGQNFIPYSIISLSFKYEYPKNSEHGICAIEIDKFGKFTYEFYPNKNLRYYLSTGIGKIIATDKDNNFYISSNIKFLN